MQTSVGTLLLLLRIQSSTCHPLPRFSLWAEGLRCDALKYRLEAALILPTPSNFLEKVEVLTCKGCKGAGSSGRAWGSGFRDSRLGQGMEYGELCLQTLQSKQSTESSRSKVRLQTAQGDPFPKRARATAQLRLT